MFCLEKFKVAARKWEARPDGQMSLHIETACGAVAGGLAGFLTTPLDVMKTLLQTQVKKPKVMCWPLFFLLLWYDTLHTGNLVINLSQFHVLDFNINGFGCSLYSSWCNVDRINGTGAKVLRRHLGWVEVESEASWCDWRTLPWRWTKSLLDLAAKCTHVCYL